MINCHGCISVFTKKKLKYLDAYYEKSYKNMPYSYPLIWLDMNIL